MSRDLRVAVLDGDKFSHKFESTIFLSLMNSSCLHFYVSPKSLGWQHFCLSRISANRNSQRNSLTNFGSEETLDKFSLTNLGWKEPFERFSFTNPVETTVNVIANVLLTVTGTVTTIRYISLDSLV